MTQNTRPFTLTPSQLRAALAGRLEQVRMPVEPQPGIHTNHIVNHPCGTSSWQFWTVAGDGTGYLDIVCPWGIVGDRLICETECPECSERSETELAIFEDRGTACTRCNAGKVRLTFDITGIRVERLGDMSEADAYRCGVERLELTSGVIPGVDPPWNKGHPLTSTYVEAYQADWNAQHGQRHPWASSPWCWVLDVRKVGE
jgi:hypothetical protein